MILTCSCKHEAQDELHGKSRRVFNALAKGEKATTRKYRCTVCQRETEANEQEKQK